ncbi:Ran-binding protein M homolog [Linum perenne]
MITATCSEMPTKLKAKITDRIVVLPNKLSVKCEDVFRGSESVQANKPVPVNPNTGYYYFEMQVKNALSTNSCASIGFTTQGFEMKFLPGVKVNFGHKPFAYDIEARYPCPCSHCLVNDDSESATTIDDSKSSVSNEDCWKKLMEKSEKLLRKSIEDKEEELASLKAVLNAISDNFQKYV